MQLALVIGNVVSIHKNEKLESAKLMLTRSITAEGQQVGVTVLAIDSVGAGIGETVLLVLEGRAATDVLERKGAPVDAAIIGIVDRVDYS